MAGLVTRFAPSPTGPLHLGHAFAALTADRLAREGGGQMCLRFEDIDVARCRPFWEDRAREDLRWLGLEWTEPVVRQSERGHAYAEALGRLEALGLVYLCCCTRADIRAALSAPQEGAAMSGPDGPVYPGTCRNTGISQDDATVRLNMRRAVDLIGPVSFNETSALHYGNHTASEQYLIERVGDIVLARRDLGTSYHLAVVIDDAEQGVNLVSRGDDLLEVTPIHRVLQSVLGLPEPRYHHHPLVRDEFGKRLAKRDNARSLATLRAEGMTPDDLRQMLHQII